MVINSLNMQKKFDFESNKTLLYSVCQRNAIWQVRLNSLRRFHKIFGDVVAFKSAFFKVDFLSTRKKMKVVVPREDSCVDQKSLNYFIYVYIIEILIGGHMNIKGDLPISKWTEFIDIMAFFT